MADRLLSIPDYLLEQYALGELPAEETRRLDRRVEADADLRARLDALRASNERILAAYPAEEFARAVELRRRVGATAAGAQGARRSYRTRWMVLAPAMAAVAVFALVVVKQNAVRLPGDEPLWSSSQGDVTREKGKPQLRIYRRGRAGVDSLRDNDTAGCGDILQLSYVAVGRLHGVIVSVDGRGAVTLHFPAGPDRSTRLAEQGETPLPDAYELDDAPAYERFVLVTSSAPIDVQAVLAAARASARATTVARLEPLPLPSRLEQTSFLIRKRGSSL